MADSVATLTHKIDSLVFDCFQKSSDIILQGRRCSLEPENSSSSQSAIPLNYKDNSDYCYQILKDWKVNLNSPVVLDVSLLDPETKGFHLMERWKIIYKRKDDTKDGRLSSVSRRIVTLMRTLYCFVRLLPGFQLLNMSPTTPILSFRLYNPEQPPSRNFVCETSYYDFPRIQTFRGTLYLGVRYMAVNILQRILQIPPGLLILPLDVSQFHEGRSASAVSSTIPIPIPGMGMMGTGTEIQQSSQLVQSSSEKTQSRFSFSAAGPTAYRNSVDTGNGADGIGFGNRQKEYTNLRPHQYSNPDEGGYRRDNVSVGVQSRSLDSRPSGLHTQVAAQAYEQSQNVGGQSIQTQQLRFEEDANGAELLKYSLSTPPKHPHRLQYASYHSGSNVGTIGATLQSDPSNRYNPTLGVGSYVSESGSSPGGGTPFYLPMAAVIGQTGTGANPKDGSAGRGESRARSGSNFTGLGLGETEGDVTGGGGVSAASPPYLGFSTHLMSTSPEIGHSNGAMNNLERSQGAITLYQTPGCRRSLRGEAESRLQHNSQLVYNLKNKQQTSLNSESIAISLNLHVVLPRSPFDPPPMIYGDSYNAVASELIVRPRSHLHSNSQMHHRGSYGDNARGSMSSGRGTPVALDDGSVRQPSFSCGIEEEDMYDREYLENDEDEEEADEEEEEEDMPFAWVDHSMVATHSFDTKVKSDCSMGEDYSNCERDTAFAERKVDGSSPSFSQKNTSYSYVIPPSLVSFPDAPWYESGSAAVVNAVFNQLNEYKEFRSTFPS